MANSIARSSRSAAASSPLLSIAVGVVGLALATSAALRSRMRLNPRGKVVLITGGSRGLGLVMARQFARAGAKVAICGRDAGTLSRAQAELRQISPDVLAIVSDVTHAYDVKALVQHVRDELDPIDILINNVSTLQLAPAQLMTEADYQQAIDSTFWSAYRATEEVLPDMRRRGGGRIANIASIGGLVAVPHLAAYATAKHALVGYSRTMRAELRRDGVLVTTVNPGLMRTGSPRQISVKGNVQAEYAWFKIADSLPVTSMSAERAAAKIIDAVLHGDADLTLTAPAKLAARVQSLFPNMSAAAATFVNGLLPAPTGDRHTSVSGAEAESPVTKGPLGRRSDEAARRNNETDP